MRTVILCLTLALACYSAAAAEQVKAPKKVSKTSAVKHAANPAVAQKLPARKKVIKPGASKPTVRISRKTSKTRPLEPKSPVKVAAKGAQDKKGIETAALDRKSTRLNSSHVEIS